MDFPAGSLKPSVQSALIWWSCCSSRAPEWTRRAAMAAAPSTRLRSWAKQGWWPCCWRLEHSQIPAATTASRRWHWLLREDTWRWWRLSWAKVGEEPEHYNFIQMFPVTKYNMAPTVVAVVGSVGTDVLSQAQDEASVLYEASASGDPAVIGLLLEYGADANVATHTGYMPIHRVSHRGYLQ